LVWTWNFERVHRRRQNFVRTSVAWRQWQITTVIGINGKITPPPILLSDRYLLVLLDHQLPKLLNGDEQKQYSSGRGALGCIF
jgi:hypothetical protein